MLKMKNKQKIIILLLVGLLANFNCQKTYSENSYPLRSLAVTVEQSKASRDEVCKNLNSDVDIENGEVVSDSERESWKNNSESIKNSRDKNTLEDYFMGKSDKVDDLITQIIKYAGVYIVFAVLSILGLFAYIICCACESCCPPCKMCMKSCKRESQYQGFGKYWSAIGTYVGCIMIFVMGIVGLTQTNGLENSFHVFSCAGLQAFHGISFGGGNFQGVEWLKNELTTFKEDDLGNIVTLTGQTFTGSRPAWVDVEKEVMDRVSTAMKLENCASAVPSGSCGIDGCQPQYQSGDTAFPSFDLALSGETEQTWTSGQSCNGQTWAPEITSYTYTTSLQGSGDQTSIFFGQTWEGQVDAAIQLYEGAYTGISTAVDGIEEAAKSINDQTGTLETSIEDAIKGIESFQDQILNLMSDITKFHSDYKGILGSFTTSMQTFMYLFIFFSVIIALIITLVYFKEMYKLRYILHGCWAIQTIIMIITFIFTALMMIISITGEQACDIMDRALNDPQEFDRFSAKIDKDIREKIKICKRELNPTDGEYGGKDDISTAFGIGDQLQDIRNLRDELKGFLSSDGDFQQGLDQLQEVPENLDLILNNLTQLKEKQSYTVDGNIIFDHLAFSTIIDAFNAQACTQNEIQANENSCTNTANTNFAGSLISDSACFELQIDFTGHTAKYGVACPGAETQISDLISWRNEKNLIVDLKTEQTQGLKNQLRYYIALHSKYTSNVETFNNQVIDALNFIAHEQNGILAQVKCFWFGTQLDTLYDSLCVSFVNSCYSIGFVMAIFSFSMYFTVFFIYMSVRRMGINQKFSKQTIDITSEKQDEYAKPEYRDEEIEANNNNDVQNEANGNEEQQQ